MIVWMNFVSCVIINYLLIFCVFLIITFCCLDLGVCLDFVGAVFLGVLGSFWLGFCCFGVGFGVFGVGFGVFRGMELRVFLFLWLDFGG